MHCPSLSCSPKRPDALVVDARRGEGAHDGIVHRPAAPVQFQFVLRCAALSLRVPITRCENLDPQPPDPVCMNRMLLQLSARGARGEREHTQPAAQNAHILGTRTRPTHSLPSASPHSCVSPDALPTHSRWAARHASVPSALRSAAAALPPPPARLCR
jgi:hypothetical protein